MLVNNLLNQKQVKGTKKSIVFENIGTESSNLKDSNKDLLESLAKELHDNQRAMNERYQEFA